MADVSKTVAIIFQGQDQTGAALGSVERGLAGIGTAGAGAADKLDAITKSTEKLGNVSGKVDTLANSLKAIATTLVAKAFIDANVEAEKFDRAMTLLKGSSEAARAEFEYVGKTANTLGINLFVAADAYTSLTAATRGTALEGQQTRDIFEAVSKAMSSLGKSGADTQGALLAISQIVSKGNVSLEELRGQLGERLPGAFQIAARAMGVTTQELDKLVSSGNLTAEEFLPKFTAALNEAFGDTSRVEGYAAAFARLQNAVGEAFIEIGRAGTFDALTAAVNIGTAAITGAISAFSLLGEIVGAVAGAIASGNFSDLGTTIGEAMSRAGERTQFAWEEFKKFTDAGADVAETARATAGSVNLFASDVARYTETQKGATFSAKEFAAELKRTTDTSQLEALRKSLKDAFDEGRISADKFGAAVDLLDKRQASLDKTSKATTDALKRQTEETKRAEEAAQKMALELEKIASNERIKFMEFKFNLDVERIKAQAEQVKAAFESVSNTIDSTGDVLNTLFGLFKDYSNLDWSAIRQIEKQMDLENQRRDDAMNLQRDLVNAQIEVLRAQERALSKGDAIIKIDGAGLQPHLEGFMWEILKKIQTRVNQDGLNLLLGI